MSEPTFSNAPESQFTLRDIGRMFRRNLWLIAAVTLVMAGAAAVLSSFLPRSYESETTLRFGTKQTGGMMGAGQLSPLMGLGLPGMNDELETDVGVMRSRRIAAAVVEKASLHVVLDEPKQPRGEVLQIVRAPVDARAGTWELRLRSDGGYAVRRVKGKGPAGSLPERVDPRRPFRLADVDLALAPALRAAPPERIVVRVEALSEAVERLRDEVIVDRESGTRLVTVRYSDTDPRLAAAVVNGLAQDFIAYRQDASSSDSRGTAERLAEQVRRYETDLRDAEQRMRAFRESARVVEPEAQATQQIRRGAEMQTKRDALQVERTALAQLIAEVERAQGRPGPSPYRRLATFPTFVANAGIQTILENLTKLENERSELGVRRTEADDELQGLDTRIGQLELQLYQLATSYLSSVDKELSSLNGALASFGTELEAIPAKDLEFARLLREQKLLAEIHTYLQTRLEQARIEETTDAALVRVVDPGEVPTEPVSPRPMINLLLGLILGVLAGAALAVGRELMDTRVRGGTDALLATGNLPVLGVVPRMGAGRALRTGSLRQVIPILTRGPSGHSLVKLRRDAGHPELEAFRALRARLLRPRAGGAPRLVVVASASPGDGKSTVSVNTATAFAQRGTRVLLADADLRGGVLHGVFDAPQGPGLADVLAGRATLDEAVREVEAGGGRTLYLLPAGTLPLDPAELLGSPAMARLADELREEFDVVVFDTPPLSEGADAALLGSVADTTVLVARHGVTQREALQGAAARLREFDVAVSGVVMNGEIVTVRPSRYTRAAAASA